MTPAQRQGLIDLRSRVKKKFDDSFWNKSTYAYRLGVLDALVDSNANINTQWFIALSKYDK